MELFLMTGRLNEPGVDMSRVSFNDGAHRFMRLQCVHLLYGDVRPSDTSWWLNLVFIYILTRTYTPQIKELVHKRRHLWKHLSDWQVNTHSSKLISEQMQKLSPTISHTNENGAGHKRQSHRPFTSLSMNEIKCELSWVIRLWQQRVRPGLGAQKVL